MSKQVVDLEIERSESFGAGGFVELRRYRVRNLREDGSRSASYLLDVVERPGRPDAVVVLAHDRDPGSGEPRVLLRRGLRPVVRLGRGGLPTREGELPGIQHLEAVAGILEPEDEGEAGLRRRAALELREEVGLDVAPERIELVGPPVCASPGIMAERIYFCRVEAPLEARGPGAGDGSLLEEGGAGLVLPLGRALEACRRGEIQDAKTELALRRLAEEGK